MKLSEAVTRLMGSWWQADRIRLHPDEGRLLSLQPPCYLRIGGQTVEVLARRALVEDSVCGVVYDCADEQQQGELRVELTSLRQPPRVLWSVGGVVLDLTTLEVEVFQSVSQA